MEASMDFAVLLAAIAGVTELLNRLRAKDYWVATTIVTAVVIGGLFGATGYYPGLDTVEGMVAGFSASGTLSALGSIGKKSTAKPSEALTR